MHSLRLHSPTPRPVAGLEPVNGRIEVSVRNSTSNMHPEKPV